MWTLSRSRGVRRGKGMRNWADDPVDRKTIVQAVTWQAHGDNRGLPRFIIPLFETWRQYGVIHIPMESLGPRSGRAIMNPRY